MTTWLAPGMTVFDVGANVGPYALVAARRVGDRGSVHAFEPTPKSAAGLRRNVGLNGLTNVVVNEVAVSDTAGEVNLYLDEESAPQNSIVSNVAVDRVHRILPSIRVPTVTLDGYAAGRPALDKPERR